MRHLVTWMSRTALAVLAVLLNWATTGDHLLKTLEQGFWPVAGLDLALLVSGGIAVTVARKLRRREQGLDAGRSADDEAADEADRGVSGATVAAKMIHG